MTGAQRNLRRDRRPKMAGRKPRNSPSSVLQIPEPSLQCLSRCCEESRENAYLGPIGSHPVVNTAAKLGRTGATPGKGARATRRAVERHSRGRRFPPLGKVPGAVYGRWRGPGPGRSIDGRGGTVRYRGSPSRPRRSCSALTPATLVGPIVSTAIPRLGRSEDGQGGPEADGRGDVGPRDQVAEGGHGIGREGADVGSELVGRIQLGGFRSAMNSGSSSSQERRASGSMPARSAARRGLARRPRRRGLGPGRRGGPRGRTWRGSP